MKPSWLVVVPVWGAAYRELFLDVALPAILAALRHARTRARFLIHTDRPEQIGPALAGHAVEFRHVPRGSKYDAFGRGHQEGLASAAAGEFVALLNADLVPSVEAFAAAERRFAEGKRAVIVAGARTLLGDTLPPVGASAGALHDYALANLHPINRDCFFGKGRTVIPSIVYFADGQGVVMRGFHLHPFAVVAASDQRFSGTIDRDLVDCFALDDMHVVTDRDEMAFAEISPPEKVFGTIGRPIDVPHIVNWARRGASRRHRELFRHPIVLQGRPSGFDERIAKQILQGLSR